MLVYISLQKKARERQIKKFEQEIERNKKSVPRDIALEQRMKEQRELQNIKRDFGSILPKEYFILYKYRLNGTSIGDGDEYCSVCCARYNRIQEELEKSGGKYIEDLVGSSKQSDWYSWDIEKNCWFDDRGKKVFNFKQRFIKDFQDNLKEVQGLGKPKSGYDDWEQWERDEVAEYLKNIIKELQRKL